jgi:lipopolysaccharide transport system ATP-binding protein
VSASEVVLDIQGIWKRYTRRGHGQRTLKRTLLSPSDLLRRDRFWALQDINLHVESGETVGLIGANGSGKSTLLRLVGGLGRPTRGRIQRFRNVGAMMTLGESFDPLLTGRENAVTAGIVSGYTRREVERKLDEIVAFAELDEFFDHPIRTYSDGMRMRLAFAVAISNEPELMLIDEVLAVGDLRFQNKCFERLQELQKGGATILLASHDQEQIAELCTRVLWLAHGRMQAYGTPDEVYDAYRDAMQAETERRLTSVVHSAPNGSTTAENRFGTREVQIAAVRFDPQRLGRATPDGTMPLRLEIDLVPTAPVQDPIVSVSLRRVADASMVLDVNTAGDNIRLGLVDKPMTIGLALDRLDLEPGSYRFDVGVYEQDWGCVYDYHWQAYPFELSGGASTGFGPRRRWTANRA